MSFDIVIKQGKTFSMVFRYAAEPVVFKAISAASNTAPLELTVPSHGLVNGWPAAIISMKGMTEPNAQYDPPRASEYLPATVVDVNTLRFPDINAADFGLYSSGGYVRYFTPVDLAGCTARMKIKNKAGGTEYSSLVSPTNITIDNVLKTITVTIAATATALFDFRTGVYDLELDNGGVVTEIASGNVELVKEVTA